MRSFIRAQFLDQFGWLLALMMFASLACASPAKLVSLPKSLAEGGHTPPVSASSYSYFETPSRGDLWSAKISAWQRRERESHETELLAPVSGVGEVTSPPMALSSSSSPNSRKSGKDLRASYAVFRAHEKRELARSVVKWVQAQARTHYIPDGPVDHWATLEETLSRNGDDCDGLELLAYNLLRDLGFDEKEIFRAVVYRPSDGQHHMVTLWFEDRADPWVLDPTGAMTKGMPHMSEKSEWVPLKLFTETGDFTVKKKRLLAREPG